jgi:predicted DCC family thiol-disulfide oxidoreductase YuxK
LNAFKDASEGSLDTSTTGIDAVPAGHALVLFDGVCNLCSAAVQFIIDRDPAGHFVFASLQSELGQRILAASGRDPTEAPETVLLVENGVVHDRSTAALLIARHLRGGWKLLRAAALLPRPLRDAAYRLVARNRYRWFGQAQECRVPTPELRARFLA